MVLLGFATDRGFGHWSRVRNYVTLPALRDRAVMMAPISPASLSWKDVDTIGYVDPGVRMILKDGGGYEEVRKYDPGVGFQGSWARYYGLPWSVAMSYGAEAFVIDAHNEPELLYCHEFLPQYADVVARVRAGAKLFFTLETQAFPKLPLRYVKAFECVEKIIIPYEKEFFTRCVPTDALEAYSSKLEFVGNIISPDVVSMLRVKKEEARSRLNLPADQTIVFCTYGRGEGAGEVVRSIFQIGETLRSRLQNLHFIVSDPTGEFAKTSPKKPWVSFIGLDYQRAMTTLAASDCTIQGLGTSTLLETLVAGKPMVAVSLSRPYEEQASKGRGVAALELGEYIPLEDLSPDRLTKALMKVLEGEYGTRFLKNTAGVLCDLNGAQRVASMLLSYMG